MKKMLIVKTALGVSLASISLSSIAADNKVICPSVNLVKRSWVNLDTVTKAPGFVVWDTASPVRDAESRSWYLVTYPKTTSADTMDSAFKMGQAIVQTVADSDQKYAIHQGGEYLCSYKSPHTRLLSGVAMISYVDESERNMKLTTIDLNALK